MELKRQVLFQVLLILILADCGFAFLSNFWWRKTTTTKRLRMSTVPRFTFDGMDYDYDSEHPNITMMAQENIDIQKSCTGEYVRCTLREPFAMVVCGFQSYNKRYDNYYSICEIEYLNCRYEEYYNQTGFFGKIFGKSPYSGELNPRWYDGDGPGCAEATHYGGYSYGRVAFSAKNYTRPYWDYPRYYPKWSKYAPR